MAEVQRNPRTSVVISAAIEMHRCLGPGLMPVHTAQVLTYLRLTGAQQALLLNLNCVTLKEGLRSFLGGREQRFP